jgi:hypothetical protein
MDFIKKNPLLCAWLLVSLILAVFLGWRISGAMAAAAEASGQFEELRGFGQRERRASYSASNENLAISKRNLERAETELRNLRVALYQRSNVVHEANVSNTKCKNHLIEGTRELVNRLTTVEGVLVHPEARGLSFSDVITSEKLPDQTVEVPVLMKQFEIIEELVGLVAGSDISELRSISRSAGVGTAEIEELELMPLSMKVAGDSASVKQLLTKLQSDSKYFFIVRNVKLSAPGPMVPEAVAPVKEVSPERMPGMPEDGMQDSEEGDGSTPEMRRIRFGDLVVADIRFDFVEFRNPLEEN